MMFSQQANCHWVVIQKCRNCSDNRGWFGDTQGNKHREHGMGDKRRSIVGSREGAQAGWWEKQMALILQSCLGWVIVTAGTPVSQSWWNTVNKNTNYFHCSLTSTSCTTSKTGFIIQPLEKELFSIFLLYKNEPCAMYQLQAVQLVSLVSDRPHQGWLPCTSMMWFFFSRWCTNLHSKLKEKAKRPIFSQR